VFEVIVDTLSRIINDEFLVLKLELVKTYRNKKFFNSNNGGEYIDEENFNK